LNPPKKNYCGDCGISFDPVIGTVNTYLAANLGGQLDALIKDRFGGQPIVELQIASNVAEKLVGWSKLFGSILGVVAALIVIILAVLGFTSVSSFRADVAKKQQDAETSINRAQQDAERSIQGKVQASQNVVDGLLEQSKFKSDQTIKQLKRAGDEIGQKLQQDRKAAYNAEIEISALRVRAQALGANLDATTRPLHYVSTPQEAPAQARQAVDIRATYEKLKIASTGTDTVNSGNAIQSLRKILTATGYKPDANATAQDLLVLLRAAMVAASEDDDKLASLSAAIESTKIE
jgi:type II secretory pathway pseudopilin PulG